MKRRPRVLMFAPAFAPNFFSEALVNSKLALAMLEAGWDVIVFSAKATMDSVYTSGWGAPWESLQDIVYQISPSSATRGLKKLIETGSMLAIGLHPVPGAIWAGKAALAALDLNRDRPFDLIMTRSTSCFAHLPGLIVKRHIRSPWIANWNDPPAHLFPDPYRFSLSPWRRFLFERYLRNAAHKADINTFPSARLMTYMSKPLRLNDPRRMAVVPHIGLGFKGHPPHKKRDVFRISHVGNLIFTHT